MAGVVLTPGMAPLIATVQLEDTQQFATDEEYREKIIKDGLEKGNIEPIIEEESNQYTYKNN